MTKKNRVATIIAACIVIAAGVTGSVYAAVTVAHDKEEAESSTVVTTEAETSTEATTEATTEVVTTTVPATTKQQATATSTNDSDIDLRYISPEHYNSMTPEQKEASYQLELSEINAFYASTIKTSEDVRVEPPEPLLDGASDEEKKEYYEYLEHYNRREAQANDIRQKAEETKIRLTSELNQRYGK